MAFDELLADRVRACLQQVAGVSEKKMFGGLAFLIGGHLTVGVYGDGLIARIGAQDMDAATAEPGVRPFDMTGRPMRPNWRRRCCAAAWTQAARPAVTWRAGTASMTPSRSTAWR
jgi:hypothetical protein